MTPRRAFLERTQSVDITDLSRGGCCVETGQPLQVGAVGVLSVDIEGETHAEVFRVARAAEVPGTRNQFSAGVEFLPMPADMPSLVEVVAQLDVSEQAPDRAGRRFRE